MSSSTLALTANAEMCAHCFDVIVAKLNRHPTIPKMSTLDEVRCPLFVTLHIVNGRNKELRGCIGTLSPGTALSSALQSYAISSAFKDNRFLPLEIAELDQIELSVSLLVQYEDGTDCLDWVPIYPHMHYRTLGCFPRFSFLHSLDRSRSHPLLLVNSCCCSLSLSCLLARLYH